MPTELHVFGLAVLVVAFGFAANVAPITDSTSSTQSCASIVDEVAWLQVKSSVQPSSYRQGNGKPFVGRTLADKAVTKQKPRQRESAIAQNRAEETRDAKAKPVAKDAKASETDDMAKPVAKKAKATLNDAKGRPSGKKHNKGKDGEEKVLDRKFYEETKNLRKEFIILDPHLAIAICLLFAIVVTMGLLYIVHWNDWDMRYYAWLMISTTISIFVAVLWFQTVNTLAVQTVFRGSSRTVLAAWNFGQLLIYYFLMQISTAFSSGALHLWTFWREPFNRDAHEWQDGKVVPLDVHQQKFQMRGRTRCWASLFAHATGFAALSCGGSLQHALSPERYPALSFIIPIAMFFALTLLFWITRFARLSILQMSQNRAHTSRSERWARGKTLGSNIVDDDDDDAAWAGGKVWAFETWDDETYDAEEDAAGVSVAFLIIQALRLNITGRLSNNFGVEEHHYIHPVSAIGFLVLWGLVFSVVHVALVSQKWRADSWSRLAKRIYVMATNVSCMGFAWCLLYAAQYTEARSLTDEAPWTITTRLILAFCISVATFGVIFVMEQLTNLGIGGKEIFFNMSLGSSMLVGFSWEQCFDRAVEVMGEASGHPDVVNICMVSCLTVIVVIPWRRHVLSNVMLMDEEMLKQERNNEHSQERGASQ